MTALIALFVVIVLGFNSYREAKRRGVWKWTQFFGLLGAVAVFTAVWIVPLAYSRRLQQHPALFMALMFGGIALFVAGILWWFRKKSSPGIPQTKIPS